MNFYALIDAQGGADGLGPTYAKVEAWLNKKGIAYSMPRNAEGPIILKIDLKDLDNG